MLIRDVPHTAFTHWQTCVRAVDGVLSAQALICALQTNVAFGPESPLEKFIDACQGWPDHFYEDGRH
jgi:hypothetical protein